MMTDLIKQLRQSASMQFSELDAYAHEAADRIEELEKSNKNRGAAVVLAQEVIAKNDKRIEELEAHVHLAFYEGFASTRRRIDPDMAWDESDAKKVLDKEQT